ncbi:Ferredoxin-thioredoxin reductase catalytic chain chloroplastic [Bienertia sinuspersici]
MTMKSLQASTAYSFPISCPSTSPRRFSRVIRAQVEPSDKSMEVMRKFSEQFCRKSGTYFCVDKSVTAVVIKGLAEHRDTLGAPLCPCRHYDDKEAEASQGHKLCV